VGIEFAFKWLVQTRDLLLKTGITDEQWQPLERDFTRYVVRCVNALSFMHVSNIQLPPCPDT
jgi:hypothetical protein